ncbi:alpha-phosphoglucomutase [Desulfonispora thiosulfatigenes DSM 11270]|uniref:Phosphoglucomutase n=1 Tax=Desulfonispora thiosulfatigenes DSM 11270 TaxID=656914 RepID=A0A1W1V5C4_DESTI|nr:phospho-sugar mutase [Desulfonispora thiosulfatigenes]SMB88548.1 alpha-phosphoglucomutase [Desulfonispora thiosulfatigenes DSM 11270]
MEKIAHKEHYLQQYQKWINTDSLNEEMKAELLAIKDDKAEIEERFYKNLEFGTGGLRGLMGAGTNRINIYTVRRSTQGLANYLKKQNLTPCTTKTEDRAASKGTWRNIDHPTVKASGQTNTNKTTPLKVVIAYDSRFKSREFALESALVLAQNGIKAYVFAEIAPTPLLSYAVCELGADAGIVITASHNPKEYNGYKVYGNYGGQMTDEDSRAVIEQVENIQEELSVAVMAQKEAEAQELLVWLGSELLDRYIERTKGLILNPEIIEKMQDSLKIVYTPLHGTGNIPVMRLLQESGFKEVAIVPEQAEPDGSFPTASYPNPEDIKSFALAIELGKANNADILLATDPDADRVGVIVKNERSEYVSLTGNQLGGLLVDYILSSRKEKNTLPADGVIIKTIVTSSLGVDIARKYGIGHIDVLTGFKYIGEKINEFTHSKSSTYLFGYEESYGYLASDYVRDKDAVQICLLASEMAAFYKDKGITLYERLHQLFTELGYYQEDLVNITLEGIAGEKTIAAIIEDFRNNPPHEVHGERVLMVCDYLTCTEVDMIEKIATKTTLPKSNVLRYRLSDGSWFCIRPSGTEPKLKIYFGVKGNTAEEATTKLEGIKVEVMQRVNQVNV